MKINNAKEIIAAAELANDTVIMEGKHGIGKSNIVKQFAKEKNYCLIELFLSHQEVGDIIGIPNLVVSHGESITTWSKPSWLQRMIHAAWPMETEFGSLGFNDKDFKAFVEMKLDTSKDSIVDRDTLNDLYATYYHLDKHTLHLVSAQTHVFCADSRKSVLFLDELNRAPTDVRQSALQLVLEKQIHEHDLPYVNGMPTIIVAAINPSDGYQVDELDPALLDRFLHITVEADTKAWLDWAKAEGISDVIRDFLIAHTDRIHYMPEDGSKGATPRSWAKLDGYVKNFETIPRALHSQIVKGKIGDALAGQFISFYNNYANVLKVDDIEKIVAKEAKKTTDPKVISAVLKPKIDKLQAIAQTELAEQLLTKYINAKTEADALPMLAYYYTLNLEVWYSFIKKQKESDTSITERLGKLDSTNQKELFKQLTKHLKNN